MFSHTAYMIQQTWQLYCLADVLTYSIQHTWELYTGQSMFQHMAFNKNANHTVPHIVTQHWPVNLPTYTIQHIWYSKWSSQCSHKNCTKHTITLPPIQRFHTVCSTHSQSLPCFKTQCTPHTVCPMFPVYSLHGNYTQPEVSIMIRLRVAPPLFSSNHKSCVFQL